MLLYSEVEKRETNQGGGGSAPRRERRPVTRRGTGGFLLSRRREAPLQRRETTPRQLWWRKAMAPTALWQLRRREAAFSYEARWESGGCFTEAIRIPILCCRPNTTLRKIVSVRSVYEIRLFGSPRRLISTKAPNNLPAYTILDQQLYRQLRVAL
jgi:hypothetical protein